MSWVVECGEEQCNARTWSSNIVELISKHRNKDGLFVCSECGSLGYIEKRFSLQEPGETWEPYLKGIITLGERDRIYQPFVFLVSYEPKEPPRDVWFSYYKDTRHLPGGKLKLGYGPGGPPVLGETGLVELVKRLVQLKCIDREKMLRVVSINA